MYLLSLRDARVNSGLSLKEAAKATGKQVKTLEQYENDSSKVPYWTEKKLCEVYHVPMDLIYFGAESDLIERNRNRNQSA